MDAPDAGLLMALAAKGDEDRFLFNAGNETTWDARKRFLRQPNEPYTTAYSELHVEVVRLANTVRFTLCRAADLVNDVDLAVRTDEVDVGNVIKRVEVHIGCERIDGWEGTDVGTLIRSMCAVFKRTISRHGDLLFVPLAVAPFHAHNLLPLVGINVEQKVTVEVEFASELVGRASFPETFASAKLYGRTYFLSSGPRRLARSYDMGIAEVQAVPEGVLAALRPRRERQSRSGSVAANRRRHRPGCRTRPAGGRPWGHPAVGRRSPEAHVPDGREAPPVVRPPGVHAHVLGH